MGSANLAGKEKGAREEMQDQGAGGDFAHPRVITKKAQPAEVVGTVGRG